ncbi:MAG: O-antigen ligase, partial [Rhizomicrobium sp.]
MSGPTAHSLNYARVPMAEAPAVPWQQTAILFALLTLVFVGVQPFQERMPATDLITGPYQTTGGGDALRQILYLLIFASAVTLAFLRRGLDLITVVPPMLIAILSWCLLSALWAEAQDVAVRRAVLAIVLTFSVMLLVDTLGVERSLSTLRAVMIGVLVVNWISIFAVHQSIHLPGEQDADLIGDWRGLYFHKNIAGAVCALSAMVFIFSAFRSRPWQNIALALAAMGFLVMTRSKSSLGLLPIAVVMGLAYRVAWRRNIDRLIFGTVMSFGALALVTVTLASMASISQALDDPTGFTGRSAIWAAELAFIRDHPFLGYGFGTFADSGSLSPLHNYVAGTWVEFVAHGHNGYLQLLVTIGGIGFALAVMGFIFIPAVQFWRRDGSDLSLKAMLLAIFVFIVLHNIMESDFLENDSPAWVTFLMMLAMLGRLKGTGLPRRSGAIQSPA